MVLLLGFIVGIALFLICLFGIKMGWIDQLDEQMFNVFDSLHFLTGFSFLGTEPVISIGSIALIVYLLIKRNIFGVLTILLTVAGGNLLNKWIKTVVGRERPPFEHGEDGFSFVSGHAMVGVIFYLLAGYFIARAGDIHKRYIICSAGILLAILTGLSRIVEKAHYFTDVLAGFGLGMAIALLGIYINEKRMLR